MNCTARPEPLGPLPGPKFATGRIHRGRGLPEDYKCRGFKPHFSRCCFSCTEVILPSCRPCIRSLNVSDTGGFVIRHALCLITDPSSQKYPKPFVSPSLDSLGLAWLALPQRGSSRRQQPQQQPQLQSKHIKRQSQRFAPRLCLSIIPEYLQV